MHFRFALNARLVEDLKAEAMLEEIPGGSGRREEGGGYRQKRECPKHDLSTISEQAVDDAGRGLRDEVVITNQAENQMPACSRIFGIAGMKKRVVVARTVAGAESVFIALRQWQGVIGQSYFTTGKSCRMSSSRKTSAKMTETPMKM